MITVTNISRRMQVLNLPHAVMCDEDECVCTAHEHRQSALNPKTGEHGVRVLELKISGSVHLAPGESAELDERAKDAPDVKGASARQEIRIETSSDHA